MSSNYIFGKKAILDAIKNHKKISEIKLISNSDLINLCNKYHIKYEIVNRDYFNQFKEVNHQFIIAFLQTEINYINLNEIINNSNNQRILILDNIQSPQNFGSILRSALAFNIDVIVYKNNHQAQINDLVIKTSMGAVNYLKICKVANINQTIETLKSNGYWIYGTALNNNSINLNNVNFDQKSALIVGNENTGISKLTLNKCDFIIKIDINQLIDSLNVSVATAVILYEWNKQIK